MRMNLLTALMMTTALRSPMGYDGEKIKLSYDDEAEVPVAFKSLYTEKDGVFTLTGVEGMKTATDVSKVSEALRKERNDHRILRESLRSTFGEQYDLAAIRTQLDRIDELQAEVDAGGGNPDPKKLEALVAAKAKVLLTPVERERDALKAQVGTLTGEVDSFKGKERTRTIHDALRDAAVKGKLLPEALDDALMLAERAFEVTEDGTVVTREDSPTPGLAPADWLSDMQDKKPHWWGASTGGGAGGNNGRGTGTNPWSADHWNLTLQGQMTKTNPTRAAALRAAAGVELGATKPRAKN